MWFLLVDVYFGIGFDCDAVLLRRASLWTRFALDTLRFGHASLWTRFALDTLRFGYALRALDFWIVSPNQEKFL